MYQSWIEHGLAVNLAVFASISSVSHEIWGRGGKVTNG